MNALVVLVSSLACALSAPSGSGLYHGPQAVPHVLPSGHLADTHEVAAAKAAHLGALHGSGHGGHAGYAGYAGEGGYADSYGHSGGYNAAAAHGDYRYQGPLAVPHVLHDGHLADTHEVAAAKAEHFAAVAKAQAAGHAAGYAGHDGAYDGSHDGSYDGRYAGGYAARGFSGAHHDGAGYVGAYHGPLAKPVVLPSGYLADTHDVAALKGAHLSALAQASHHSAGHAYHH